MGVPDISFSFSMIQQFRWGPKAYFHLKKCLKLSTFFSCWKQIYFSLRPFSITSIYHTISVPEASKALGGQGPKAYFHLKKCLKLSTFFSCWKQIYFSLRPFSITSIYYTISFPEASKALVLHVAQAQYRELKQAARTTATRTLPNKRFNEQNNSCARALQIFVHVFAVLCKTATLNDQVLHRLRNVGDHG